MSSKNDLLRRNLALTKTVAKYRGKAFVWGQTDCLHLARSHLVAMGHRMPKIPKYKDALGAKRALKARGHESLVGLFDELLPRIAPAEAVAGDIVMLKGEGVECVTISVGRKVAGWIQSADEFVMMTPLEVEGAWRA